jgi:hypothetical protein
MAKVSNIRIRDSVICVTSLSFEARLGELDS